jgi:hypothetical protein
MCSECLGSEFSGSLNQGSSQDPRQFTDNNGAQSRSGSIAEDPKFTGASSSDMKFDGTKSDAGNNPNIGHTGWGS